MTLRKKLLTGKVAVLVISDEHTGSTVGLAPPLVHLDDGGAYHASEAQKRVYEHWQGAWKRTLDLGLPVVVIDNADAIEGFHHNTAQIWGTDPRKHIDVAVDLRMPYRNRVERWYALRGTTAHVGASGSGDETVAKEIGADGSNGTFSHYHLKLEISNVLFDVAHHPGISAGKRPWLDGNALRMLGRGIVLDSFSYKQRPPDVIVRSHIHQARHETIRDYNHRCECLVTPSFQIKTEFSHKISSERDLADIGATLIIVEDGKVLDVGFDLLRLPTARSLKA